MYPTRVKQLSDPGQTRVRPRSDSCLTRVGQIKASEAGCRYIPLRELLLLIINVTDFTASEGRRGFTQKQIPELLPGASQSEWRER
jgi:hypothetical protein